MTGDYNPLASFREQMNIVVDRVMQDAGLCARDPDTPRHREGGFVGLEAVADAGVPAEKFRSRHAQLAGAMTTLKQEKDMTLEKTKTTAQDHLIAAADAIDNRAAERDTDQERSMARAVRLFNTWRPADAGPLTEADGWTFMVLLKLARAQGGSFRQDDWVDAAAYVALALESLENSHTG